MVRKKEEKMRTKLFKILTAVAGIYHIILGVATLVFPATLMQKTIGTIMGISPIIDDQFLLVAKFAGVYALAFGAILLILTHNPNKYKILTYPVLGVFGIRLINKLVFMGTISSLYNVSMGRSLYAIISIAVFFFGILLTAPWKEK